MCIPLQRAVHRKKFKYTPWSLPVWNARSGKLMHQLLCSLTHTQHIRLFSWTSRQLLVYWIDPWAGIRVSPFIPNGPTVIISFGQLTTHDVQNRNSWNFSFWFLNFWTDHGFFWLWMSRRGTGWEESWSWSWTLGVVRGPSINVPIWGSDEMDENYLRGIDEGNDQRKWNEKTLIAINSVISLSL